MPVLIHARGKLGTPLLMIQSRDRRNWSERKIFESAGRPSWIRFDENRKTNDAVPSPGAASCTDTPTAAINNTQPIAIMAGPTAAVCLPCPSHHPNSPTILFPTTTTTTTTTDKRKDKRGRRDDGREERGEGGRWLGQKVCEGRYSSAA